VAVGELSGGAVQDLLRAGQDYSADLVLNLGLGLVDRQRADVTPVEGKRAATRDEQAARVGHVIVELGWRSDLGQLLVDVDRARGARAVRQPRQGDEGGDGALR